jgi:hypothetical protein
VLAYFYDAVLAGHLGARKFPNGGSPFLVAYDENGWFSVR